MQKKVEEVISCKPVKWNKIMCIQHYLTCAITERVAEGKMKGERWRKIKNWWEEWTHEEWRGWRVVRGLVYAWVSMTRKEIYIGSTKGLLMERCKSHLEVVKKVRSWNKEERAKRCKEEMIMPLHKHMAENIGDWVMIPLTGDIRNVKAVERRMIRRFGGKLNVVVMKKWRIKKEEEKGKRNRPVKRIREGRRKEEKKKIEEGAITVFRVGEEKYEDMEKALKEGREIKIEWCRGSMEVTNWKRIRRDWEIKDVRVNRIEVKEWKDVRRIIIERKKGVITIQEIKKIEYNKLWKKKLE